MNEKDFQELEKKLQEKREKKTKKLEERVSDSKRSETLIECQNEGIIRLPIIKRVYAGKKFLFLFKKREKKYYCPSCQNEMYHIGGCWVFDGYANHFECRHCGYEYADYRFKYSLV